VSSALGLMILGLVALVIGAEGLVRGASRLAARSGVSPLVIGLTIVAFGTSAPELAVGVRAALGGQSDIVVGNVIGSNIFNVLFILGLSALVSPLVVAQRLVWVDVPVMIGVSILGLALCWDGTVGRVDGAVLVAGIVVYAGLTARYGPRESREVSDQYAGQFGRRGHSAWGWVLEVVLVAAGFALLTAGSHWLVDGAVTVATALGVSQLVVGITIVAGGTSLPELATSVVATVKGERDIAVGNIVGSNIFNLLAVLGTSALLARGGVAVPGGAEALDIPFMVVVAVACLPVFLSGHRIERWEGALFLAYYGAYLVYLILEIRGTPGLPSRATALWLLAMPLLLLTGVVLWNRRTPPAAGASR